MLCTDGLRALFVLSALTFRPVHCTSVRSSPHTGWFFVRVHTIWSHLHGMNIIYKSSLAYASPLWPPPAATRPGLMAPPKRRSASMALHAGSWWLLQRASLQRRRRAGAGRATVAGRAGSATVATATVPLHWSGGGGKAMANVGSLCEYMAHVH